MRHSQSRSVPSRSLVHWWLEFILILFGALISLGMTLSDAEDPSPHGKDN